MILPRWTKAHATRGPSPLLDRWVPLICTGLYPPLVGTGSSKRVTGSSINCLHGHSHVLLSKTESRRTCLLVKNQSQSCIFFKFCVSVHHSIRLNINTDVMQQDADFIIADFVYMIRATCAHHQECKILTRQPPVQVVMVVGGS